MLNVLPTKELIMSNLSKRSTIYFEPAIHSALKMKAACSDQSVSQLIDQAVRLLMNEDQSDLQSCSDRINEPEISYEMLLEDLKANGKI